MVEAGQSVTVLAVDDQPIFLRTARSLIAATPGFEQVGEAASGEEAIELAEVLNPDLVLVDVRMPGMDGLETARRLTRRDPHPVVVLISLEEMPEASDAAGRTGVAACVRKQELSTRTLQELWRSVGRRD
ncbi:MAG TPA: response regulator transcription factor [Thermoleophilaceae bacterium]|jgi:DNA-binding NarL/FixJ family response regulator